jgi:hypothetical protein
MQAVISASISGYGRYWTCVSVSVDEVPSGDTLRGHVVLTNGNVSSTDAR